MNSARWQLFCIKFLFVVLLLGSAIEIAMEGKVLLPLATACVFCYAAAEHNMRLACILTGCLLISDLIVYLLSR